MLHNFFLPRDMTTKPQSVLPNTAISLLEYSIAQTNDRVNAPCQKRDGYGGRMVTAQCVQGEGAGNREQGTGIVAAARSDESIGTENTATAFPVPSAAVLRIPL
jgi:hypothetical protein